MTFELQYYRIASYLKTPEFVVAKISRFLKQAFMLLFNQIMAGLLDQYLLAGSKDALDMVVGMANYFYKRVKSVIARFTIERHWRSLNEETGGMNDILYRLYTVTVSSLLGLPSEGYSPYALNFLI